MDHELTAGRTPPRPVPSSVDRLDQRCVAWICWQNLGRAGAVHVVMDNCVNTPKVGGDDEGVRVVEVVLTCIAALAAFLTGGYAFGGVRRRKAITDLLVIRKGLPRRDDRTKIDALIERELDALVGLGDTTTRWLRGGFLVGLLFASLSTLAWMVSEQFLTAASAKEVGLYVSASLCVAATLALGLTATGAWDIRYPRARWFPITLLILSTVVTVGGFLALSIIEGTPYHKAVFGA